ncbi:DUF2795 domain-containing protein [Actinokineospora auranticolor]|uniref:Uncharacterized protein DUF2795 n=1 Tax=Actinokineospora auranticolor TaxID=155976 RepID=A0A2S6GEY3_9PSEU|nr:DUF2795 domain-containing protein [Actinokineospora auranticolor]PPK63797.1 uncharacterized protein DUF2795 [Actinokineospora auranticolor]
MNNILGEPHTVPTPRSAPSIPHRRDHCAEPTLAELRDCVGDVFLHRPATKSDMLNAALGCAARPEVFATINRLPERRYTSLADVWSSLARTDGRAGGDKEA